MLTLLFSLAAIWTLFWLILYMLDWGDTTALANPKAVCAKCAGVVSPGAMKASAAAKPAAAKSTGVVNGAKPTAGQSLGSNDDTAEKAKAAAQVKAAREDARQQAAKQASAQAQNGQADTQAKKDAAKKPAAASNNQSNVKPLFVAPKEKDDLKVIKGIGVVMEKTLNDLGITTFKQLSEFQAAEVKMVSDALDASNSGFGDRIERDEWVAQAKIIVRKAA